MAISTEVLTDWARRKTFKSRISAVGFHAAVIALGFVMLYPLLWMLGSSFKGPSEIWTNISSLIPRELTIQNYVDGWRGFAGISFATFYKNSVIVTGISTVADVFSSAVVAYGFARIRFAGRGFWFVIMRDAALERNPGRMI